MRTVIIIKSKIKGHSRTKGQKDTFPKTI